MNIIKSIEEIQDNCYDFLLVGAGLFNAVCAYELTKRGFSCLIIDRRDHIGGNCYTRWDNLAECYEHVYGAHIFHTNDKRVWDYVNDISEFNNFINQPVANYHGNMYNLPFNMNTFTKLFGVTTPDEARERIESERVHFDNPKNLEEQALSLVGTTIYETLIKEYTEKQWERDCKDLPPEIIKRLPLRFTFNNNYFNDKYQGIPIHGYTDLISKMFKNCDILLNTNFDKKLHSKLDFESIIYTGRIDEFFNYEFGELDFRSLIFESSIVDVDNYQGNAVVNYTSHDKEYTRIIEHKHFGNCGSTQFSLITKEYSVESNKDTEACYPVNNDKNTELYNKYREAADKYDNLYIEGRLGRYEYNDMDKTIEKAFNLINRILSKR